MAEWMVAKRAVHWAASRAARLVAQWDANWAEPKVAGKAGKMAVLSAHLWEKLTASAQAGRSECRRAVWSAETKVECSVYSRAGLLVVDLAGSWAAPKAATRAARWADAMADWKADSTVARLVGTKDDCLADCLAAMKADTLA